MRHEVAGDWPARGWAERVGRESLADRPARTTRIKSADSGGGCGVSPASVIVDQPRGHLKTGNIVPRLSTPIKSISRSVHRIIIRVDVRTMCRAATAAEGTVEAPGRTTRPS